MRVVFMWNIFLIIVCISKLLKHKVDVKNDENLITKFDYTRSNICFQKNPQNNMKHNQLARVNFIIA